MQLVLMIIKLKGFAFERKIQTATSIQCNEFTLHKKNEFFIVKIRIIRKLLLCVLIKNISFINQIKLFKLSLAVYEFLEKIIK